MINKLLVAIILSLVNPPTKGKHKNYIVICDVSNSITRNKEKVKNGNLGMVKSYAADIARNMKGYYTLYYLPVTDNMNEKPLPEGGITLKEGNGSVMMRQRKSNETKMPQVMAKLDALAAGKPNSCILSSIEHAFQILHNELTADSSTIIILSDMLESCEQSPLGGRYTLNIKDKNSVSKFTDSYKPNFSFQGLPLKIVIVNTTPTISSPELQTLTDSWRTVFKKMNYNGEIIIRTTVPDL